MFWIIDCAAPKPESPPSEEQCISADAGLELREESQQRGLTIPEDSTAEAEPGQGNLVAEDLDQDNDIDLIYPRHDDLPIIYENQGDGTFLARDPLKDLPMDRPAYNFAVADLNGDNLPELLMASGTTVLALKNEGHLHWSAPLFFYQATENYSFLSAAFGDLDGDGDLDVVAPSGGHSVEDSGEAPIVLQNTGTNWKYWQSLGAEKLKIQAPLLTDRDNDQDLDVLLMNDLLTRSTFWRNDGLQDETLLFSEDGETVGMGLSMGAMGMDTYDLNQDGTVDWCFSDVGPVRCFLSDAQGWYEGQSGTAPANPVGKTGTIGWSIQLADLDNDGFPELVQASGQNRKDANAEPEGPIFPDLLFAGQPDGRFVDVTATLDFGNLADHVGLVAADFDGDGTEELVLGSPWQHPLLYDLPCTENNWLSVRVEGTGANRASLGARVEVEAGGRTQIREVNGLRDHSQSPARIHVGIGQAKTIERVTVRWVDGSEVTVLHPEIRQQLTVSHP